VSLETEMSDSIKDSLTYESMVNGFNYKVSVLRQAIGGKP
jgi:flagellar basal body rod protein FlgB